MRNGGDPAAVATSPQLSTSPSRAAPARRRFIGRLRSISARAVRQSATEAEDSPLAVWRPESHMSLPSLYLQQHSNASASAASTVTMSESSLSSSASGLGMDVSSSRSSSVSNTSTNQHLGSPRLDRIIHESDGADWPPDSWSSGLIMSPSPIVLGSSPRQPPEEIDLTVSSSESEQDDDDTVTGRGAFGVGGMGRFGFGIDASSVGLGAFNSAFGGSSNDDVEILGSTTRNQLPSALLRRKRRRNPAGNAQSGRGGADAGDVIVKRQCVMDVTSVESTNVSLGNNDAVERFKKELKCSICLDQLEDMTSTTCGHIFCGECIRTAIRATAKCPLCQRHLHLEDTHRLYF